MHSAQYHPPFYFSSACPCTSPILSEKPSKVVLGSHGPCTLGCDDTTGLLRSLTTAVEMERKCSSVASISAGDSFFTSMSLTVPSAA